MMTEKAKVKEVDDEGRKVHFGRMPAVLIHLRLRWVGHTTSMYPSTHFGHLCLPKPELLRALPVPVQ